MQSPVDAAALADQLRNGDPGAFSTLLDLYGSSMLRVARGYVSSRELAEDVVQETWIAVFKGIGGFEGRASLRTWIFSILIMPPVITRTAVSEWRRSARPCFLATLCDGCVNFLEQFRSTISTLGRVQPDRLDEGFRERLLDAFRGWTAAPEQGRDDLRPGT